MVMDPVLVASWILLSFLSLVVFACVSASKPEDHEYCIELKDGKKIYLFNLQFDDFWIIGDPDLLHHAGKKVWINERSVLSVTRVS